MKKLLLALALLVLPTFAGATWWTPPTPPTPPNVCNILPWLPQCQEDEPEEPEEPTEPETPTVEDKCPEDSGIQGPQEKCSSELPEPPSNDGGSSEQSESSGASGGSITPMGFFQRLGCDVSKDVADSWWTPYWISVLRQNLNYQTFKDVHPDWTPDMVPDLPWNLFPSLFSECVVVQDQPTFDPTGGGEYILESNLDLK